MNSYDLVIIGGGLAGLSAALHAENESRNTLLLESSERIGGRLASDKVEGFTLDRGFQVLLSGYPNASAIFKSDKLKLRAFSPGAFIALQNDETIIADPMREPSAILATLFSKVGSVSDKLKIWKLSGELKKMSHAECFNYDGSTMNFLRSYGFSDRVIERFFQPFFGGIFLERNLKTNAGMFRFVFKCFSEGNAVLPEKGIEALPVFLKSKLKHTEIRLSETVISLSQDGLIKLQNGESIQARKVIVACDPSKLIPNLDKEVAFLSTVTQYFAGPSKLKSLNKKIGLDIAPESPINNFARIDEVQPSYSPAGKSLWAITTRKSDDKPESVIKRLSQIIGCTPSELKHLKTYKIAKALPEVESPQYDVAVEQSQLTESIYLAGDYLLNGSIEGALLSGKNAAIAVRETLELEL